RRLALSRSPPRSAGGTRPPTRSGRCCWPGGCCPRRCAAGSGSPGRTDGRRCSGARGTGTRHWRRWPARRAWREGRLTDALRALDTAPGRHARRLRATLTAEQAFLAGPPPGQSMIVNSFGHIAPVSVRDHETRRGGAARVGFEPGRVLHLVTDALPTTSAGYTIRTHEIALAQRVAGLDPHVATRAGYPVTQGRIDGRRLVELDGVPYHRLLPWRMPGRADTLARQSLELADALTRQLR